MSNEPVRPNYEFEGKSPKSKSLDSEAGGQHNAETAIRQKQLAMFIGGGLIILLTGFAMFQTREKAAPPPPDNGSVERLQDAARRDPGDSESFAKLNSQVQAIAESMDDLKQISREKDGEIADLKQQLSEAQNELNAQDNLFDDVDKLYKELEALKNRPAPIMPASGPQTDQSTPGYQSGDGSLSARRGGVPPLVAPRSSDANYTGVSRRGQTMGEMRRREQKVISLAPPEGSRSAVEKFQEDVEGALSDAKQPDVYDTANYVPPNAYAPATVYVGVDAATGKSAQADPQVAAFAITGPAQHVEIDGRIQQTALKGCIVNGAATGDLPTERVFVKLQKMTCPLPNGRVAVSEVEGHVTQGGKAGVRGIVVSREGDLLTKAMLAGLAEGVGRSAQQVGQSSIGIGAGGGLQSTTPDAKDIGVAALGGGVAEAGNTVSDYILERAKAYEPVVQMPTGIKVELVFISGTLLRPTEGTFSVTE